MRSRTLLLVAVAVTFGVTVTSYATAQTTATLSVDPPAQSVQPGAEEFVVRVMVDDVTGPDGLGGYALVMTYDNNVVEALTVEDSGFLETVENPVLCPSSAIDNNDGRLALFCLSVPVIPEPGPTTDEAVELAQVRFQPVSPGETVIDISETSILDPDGSDIESTATNGSVVIESPDDQVDAAPEIDAPDLAESEEDGGMNAGALAGIGLGAAAATAVVGGGALLWLRRRSSG